MKALTWHGKRDVRIETVPDPVARLPSQCAFAVRSTATPVLLFLA